MATVRSGLYPITPSNKFLHREFPDILLVKFLIELEKDHNFIIAFTIITKFNWEPVDSNPQTHISFGPRVPIARPTNRMWPARLLYAASSNICNLCMRLCTPLAVIFPRAAREHVHKNVCEP